MRREQSAGSFDDHDVGAREPIIESRSQKPQVDRAAFGLGGQMGCQGSGKSLWADGRQLARPAGGLPQSQRVVRNQLAIFPAAAAGGRLINADPAAGFDQAPGNQRGDVSLADAGIGSGDEETFDSAAGHADALSGNRFGNEREGIEPAGSGASASAPRIVRRTVDRLPSP